MKYIAILLCICALGGCGKKGPLEPKPTPSAIVQN
jgi:predicted small lipoprotein YifL